MEKVTPNNPPLLPTPIAVTQYFAIITQEGLDHPTYTIFKNTLGQIAWARTAVGIYIATLSNAFPLDHTLVISSKNEINITGAITDITSKWIDPSNIAIETTLNGSYSDSILNRYAFTIQVFTPQ